MKGALVLRGEGAAAHVEDELVVDAASVEAVIARRTDVTHPLLLRRHLVRVLILRLLLLP